jgi:hypothetical protein
MATPSTGPTGVAYDPYLSSFGITADIWATLSPVQQSQISVIDQIARGLYAQNASDVTVQKALQEATIDPNMMAKYSDAAKIDVQAFKQSLDQLRINSSVASQQQQQQFIDDKKALDEQNAASGTAYSGFRSQAQQKLATQESGVITSTRAALQKQLNDAATTFESKYGTTAAGKLPATAEGLSGQLTGGITGSQTISDALSSITSRAAVPITPIK